MEKTESWASKIGQSAGKLLVNFVFMVPLLWTWSYAGLPELFDLPSPSMKQIIGMAILLSYVAS